MRLAQKTVQNTLYLCPWSPWALQRAYAPLRPVPPGAGRGPVLAKCTRRTTVLSSSNTMALNVSSGCTAHFVHASAALVVCAGLH